MLGTSGLALLLTGCMNAREMAATAAVLPTPQAAAAPAAPVAPPAPVMSASERLAKLFKDSDEDNLRRNPIGALFRGDLRYADQFGDYITDAYLAAEKKAAEDELAALNAIPRDALGADEKVSYDTFKWQREMDLKGFEPALLSASIVRPIDHFNGFHAFFADLSSGQSAAPFKTVKDYEDNLKRIDGWVIAMDRAIGRMQEGLKAGVVQPKVVSTRVLDQLNRFVEQGVEKSPFMMPVAKFPEAVPPADQARLRGAYAATVKDKILPAYTRMRDFFRDRYLPASREAPGLSAMPGGAALYAYMVQTQTTTDMTPDEIHALGLSEVARITAAMESVKKQVGFKGTLRQFFNHIRTDKQFQPASVQALGDGYRAIGKRVDVTIPLLFSAVPKSPLEIKPVPAFLEKDQAAAYYQQGTPDGKRPGTFYFNTYDLKSRSTPGMETLYLHEAVPGHHFQISLAMENEKLPPFQRFGGNTAFVEGWALYAESLGPELGLFKDPYQLYGHLDDEMLRAIRLVVDTGLHAKGWSRQQAINYMLNNSAQGRTDAVNEIDRYIAMPAQALAYKVGQIKIRELRTRAEKALGPKFDVREFHAQVLMTGALPLKVLEAKIDGWIAAKAA
ncbi:DUF885 domain-containing protein [Sandaracinobacteroides saxicola]|uniref:DUF885 domain-containing protein n=2 Tax=Sandaracinobacteroides saxicola TaxID=2759707 RepID=A0A7G5IN06_9SPHN|nr:DUF885 domain-containing protein [Sandaracinobacteroides saxicola]